MKSSDHRYVSFSMSPKAHAKLRKIAFKSGVSMSGIVRLVMDQALGTTTDVVPHRPHVVKKRAISDVTIRIAKGIRVKIV